VVAITSITKTHVGEIKQTMILHGPTDLSKLLPEVILSGEKATKITTSWLGMLKLFINPVEVQPQSKLLLDLTQNIKESLSPTFSTKSNNHPINLM